MEVDRHLFSLVGYGFTWETRNVSYSYGDGIEAQKGVSISIEEGRKIALAGPNGAGKSTLMLMFNSILRPTSGEVLFRGQSLQYDSSSLREIGRKVGMVFQNSDDQIFAPTVYQDVTFGPVNLGFPEEKVKRYVGYALAYVGLSGYDRRPPHHLSGGEKKRVAIAGILAMEPEVMVLDEPTSNLDPASSEEIVELAYRWADEVILIENGGVLCRGTAQEVFGDAELINRARLKLPIVVDLYKELVGRGLLSDSKPPRNVLGLIDLLDSSTVTQGNTSHQTLGKIYIYSVDGANSTEINDTLEVLHVNYIGAMGTNAKILAEHSRIPLDFTYGVIDKCILKALIGKNSLIMTSGGMVDHSIRRIQTYRENSMARIEVVKLAATTESRGSYSGMEVLSRKDSTTPIGVIR